MIVLAIFLNMASDKGIVKRVSEKEIWIDETRLLLDNNGLIHIDVVGGTEEEVALIKRDILFELIDVGDTKKNIIFNLNKAGKPSAVSRKIFLKAVSHENIGKVAIWGIHPVAKILGSFLIKLSPKKDVRFFGANEDALAWLKEKA